MKRSFLAAAVLLLSWAGPVACQDSRFPEKGTWSLAAGLPDGGGNVFAIWHMLGGRLNVGFEVDYRNKEFEEEGSNPFVASNTVTREDLLIWGPSVRYYLATDTPVAPYVRATVGFQKRDAEVEQINSGDVLQNQQESATIWRLAVGADWFPADGIAIGFFTGLVGTITDAEIELGSNGTITRRIDNISTFGSGLELQLYF